MAANSYASGLFVPLFVIYFCAGLFKVEAEDLNPVEARADFSTGIFLLHRTMVCLHVSYNPLWICLDCLATCAAQPL